MHSKIQTITPEFAKHSLEHFNHGNRAPRMSAVRDLAGKIARGEWLVTHQGIAFDTDGNLIDGQHRLMAVVEAGIAVPMLVTQDADPNTFAVLDQGVKRTIGDALRLPKRQGEVLSVLARIKSGNNTQPSPQQVADLEPYFMPAINELEEFASASRRRVTSAPIRAMATLRAMTGDKDWVFLSYRAMSNLRFEDLDSGPMAFVRQMLSARRVTPLEMLARAWYAFDKDRLDNTRLQIKNPEVAVDDILRTILEVMEVSDKMAGVKSKRAMRRKRAGEADGQVEA